MITRPMVNMNKTIGTYSYTNGEKYIGDYNNDKKDGHGKIRINT